MNDDIKVLTKRAMELSDLPTAEQSANNWEALVVSGSIGAAALPDAMLKAEADLQARWGAAIKAGGWKSLVDPWWFYKKSDGKPPVLAILAESAVTNPSRSIESVWYALRATPPDKRAPLEDQVRAFIGDAFSSAFGGARLQFVDAMRMKAGPNWSKDPWAALLDPAPIRILMENQGEDNDGGMFDDPTNDTVEEKIRFAWTEAIRTWDPAILKTNPLAQFYLAAEATAGAAASAAFDFGAALATALRWLPSIVVGTAAVGATVVIARHLTAVPSPVAAVPSPVAEGAV